MTRDPDPTPPQPDASGLSREAYALLAQANLLRMRGQWQDATEKCMQVMTLAPNNASAQSLLGDIYDNQGFLDDAIQWYRMALDIQPDSPADRLKLARLLEAKARHLPPPAPAPVPERAAAPPAPAPALLRRWQGNIGDTPDALVKWAALAAGLLVVLVVIVALVQIRTASRVPVHEVSAPPVMLPALAPPPDTQPAPASNTSAPKPASAPVRDPGEAGLLATLQAAPALSVLSITVSDAQIDPRTGRLTLTYSLPPPAVSVLLRDTLLRAALVVAQAGLQSGGSQASLVTLRCIASASAESAPALLCIADTTRAQAASVAGPGALTTAQITALFAAPWFAAAVPA